MRPFYLSYLILPFLLIFSVVKGFSQCDIANFDSTPVDCESDTVYVEVTFTMAGEDTLIVYSSNGAEIDMVLEDDVRTYAIPNSSVNDQLIVESRPTGCFRFWNNALFLPFDAGFQFVEIPVCFDPNLSGLTIAPSGGWICDTSNYIYELVAENGNVQTGLDTFIASTGWNVLQFEDSNGDIQQDSIFFNPATIVWEDFSVDVVNANCGSSDGSASVSYVNSTGPYSESWMDDQMVPFSSGQGVTDLAPGNYFVEVCNVECCATEPFSVVGNIDVDLGPDLFICAGGSTVLSATVSNMVSYEWIVGGQVIGHTMNVTIDQAGEYILQVSDGSCVGSDTITVIIEQTPIFNVNFTTIDCNANTACVELIPASGTASQYSFAWNDGSIGQTSNPCGLSLNTEYTIEITDLTTGCVYEKWITIEGIPDFTITTTDATCGNANGSATIDFGLLFENVYEFSDDFEIEQITETIDGFAIRARSDTELLSFDIDNEGALLSSQSVSFIIPPLANPLPWIRIHNDKYLLYSQDESTVYLYLLDEQGSELWNRDFPLATTHSLTGISVAANEEGEIFVLSHEELTAQFDVHLFKLTNDGDLLWDKVISRNRNSALDSITVAANEFGGCYFMHRSEIGAGGNTAILYNQEGIETDEIIITGKDILHNLLSNAAGNLIGNYETYNPSGNSANFVYSGENSYTFKNLNDPGSDFGWDVDALNFLADNSTCFAGQDEATLWFGLLDESFNEDWLRSLPNGATPDFIEFTSDGSFIIGGNKDEKLWIMKTLEHGVFVSADSLVTWYDGTTVLGTGNTITGLNPGSYTVEIKTEHCTKQEIFIIEGESGPIVNINSISFGSCIDSTGCIDISVFGGTSPYSYTWSYPDAFPVEAPCNLPPGIYSVTVTDANGCVSLVTAEIVAPAPPQIIYEAYPPSCISAEDGYVHFSVSGGTAPYLFEWENGIFLNATVNDVPAGIYGFTITDSNQCTEEVEIDFLNDLNMASAINIVCESDTELGSITLVQSNPLVELNFLLSNGETSNTGVFNNLGNGNYSLEVSEPISGCSQIFNNLYVCVDTLTLVGDALLCEGDATLLDASTANPGGWTFLTWGNPDFNGIECDTCSIVTVMPSENTSYFAVFEFDGAIYQTEVSIGVYQDCVWPGDVDTNLVADHFDLLPLCLALDSVGPARTGQDLNWSGHPADDWSGMIPSYDANQKHADCDGNGIVELVDTLAITQNWGQVHRFQGNIDEFRSAQDGIPMYVEMDTLYMEGETQALPLILGTVDSIASDIYGLAFSINFDPEIIVDGSVSFNPIASWYSENNTNLAIIQKEFSGAGRLDVGVSRTNGMNISGFGQIADFIITMEDDILKSVSSTKAKEFMVSISNVKLINSQGEEIPVAGLSRTSNVIDTSTVSVSNVLDLADQVKVYPNPTKIGFELFVNTLLDIEDYELINLQGKIVFKDKYRFNGKVKINTISSGMYLLKLKTRLGQEVIKKVVVQ